MKEVYIQGRRVLVDPRAPLGEGGEAEIYDLGSQFPGLALKLWKPPTHPDFQGRVEEARAAAWRLDEQQRKIRLFPKDVPPRVVVPRHVATNRAGDRILGYTMELVHGAEALRAYAQLKFRTQAGIDNGQVLKIFRDLHPTVEGLHRRSVVIGDFNYLNVLVRSLEAFLIDADSMQFGGFPGRAYTVRFADPLICDPALDTLVQTGLPNDDTDWYAYAVMLFECLLLVHPYGGIYEPKLARDRIPHGRRPLKRISVLHPLVRYPVKGLPLDSLPDELLHFYSELFEKDRRGIFPLALLESLRWTKCAVCGTEHARKHCPHCAAAIPPEMLVEVVRGTVSIRRLFRTGGSILRAALQEGKLRWLVHENGEFRREDGTVILRGDLKPEMRYRLSGEKTVLAMPGQMVVLATGSGAAPRYPVDSYRGLAPVFDANAFHTYWLSGGGLLREDRFGPKSMGSVLPGQTRFWAGKEFGFGFYRAGGVQVAFVFDSETPGIKDTVSLPRITGEIVDATCCFSAERCWFLLATEEAGRTFHRCFLLSRDGTLMSQAEAEEGDGSWLGELCGKCAATLKGRQGSVHCLFAVTDEGLVRLQEEQGDIQEGARFPDTKGLLSPTDALFFGREGLYVVNRREVRLLTITR